MIQKNGFLYVVSGQQYVEEAMCSIDSLFRHMPDASVTVVTDKNIDSLPKKINQIILEKQRDTRDWKSNLTYKVSGLLHSPYSKTVFLDSDTYCCDSIEEIFRC